MSAEAASLAERITEVRERIAVAAARSGRSAGDVTLIAASKTHTAAAVLAAFAAGVRDFGENRVQEGAAKVDEVTAMLEGGAGPAWHFIGHVQTNKARVAAERFAILHSVDSARLLDALAKTRQSVHIFVEVNVGGEVTKHGISPEGLGPLLEHGSRIPTITVQGLMTVAPRVARADDARPVFAALRELAQRHRLRSLSMGMTNDFEAAIEEGATHVRIGRAIFGERTI